MTLKQQAIAILRSRKFWSVVAAIAATWTVYFTAPGAITPNQAVQATVAALAAYCIGVGMEGPAATPLAPLVDKGADTKLTAPADPVSKP